MKYVICSGHFSPLHQGHLDYLEEASELGDRLFCIINNDFQVSLKGSVPFMDETSRQRIVHSLRCVDDTFISIDEDLSVCRTLEWLHNLGCAHVFANSGDVSEASHVREADTCRRLGIEIAFLNQPKVASSSELLRLATRR